MFGWLPVTFLKTGIEMYQTVLFLVNLTGLTPDIYILLEVWKFVNKLGETKKNSARPPKFVHYYFYRKDNDNDNDNDIFYWLEG